MKRKILFIVSVLFLGIMTGVFLSPSIGNAFWYGFGEEFAADAPDDPQAVHDALVEHYLPGLSDLLFIHDTIADDEAGQVTIHTNDAWDGYTLLTSFGGLCAVPEIGGGVCPPPSPPTFAESTYIGAGLCKLEVDSCPVPFLAYWSILVDMEGNLVKAWPLVGGPVEMLPSGNVRGGHFVPPAPGGGGGGGLPSLVEMNWSNVTEWFWNGPPGKPGGAIVHHDHQAKDYHVYYTPDGDQAVPTLTRRTLVLSNHSPGTLDDGEDACPDTSGISNFTLQDDAIYEIDEITGAVLFAWYPCEHFDEMEFDDVAQEGIRNYAPDPAAGGLGTHYNDNPSMTTDWQHINSASYLGPNQWYDAGDERFHPDNIIYDSRTNNMIAIIARNDNAGAGISAGDIVWKVGPHYKEGYKEERLGQINGVHMAHMIPKGLPGAGNILLYDNGGASGYGPLLPGLPGYYPNAFRSYSRILEFNPITLKKVWEYKCPEDRNAKKTYERKFYSMLISGTQRLENGNTLICEGQPGRIFEVTPKKQIAWEYISEFDNGFALGPAGFLGPRPVYRAYRVPEAWVIAGQAASD